MTKKDEVKKYHYTIGNRLGNILEDGEIRLAEGFKKRGDAVWVSTNKNWEETANKFVKNIYGGLSHGNKETTHKLYGGLARIEVEPDAAPFNWKQYVKLSKVPGKWKRSLASIARDEGSNPNEWYISYKPILKNQWKKIETFNWETQEWEPSDMI